MTTTISGSTGINLIQNGAITKANLPAGTVLQVVGTSNTSQISTTSTSPVTSGISATITPTSATSKILILVSVAGVYAQSSAQYFTLYRNGVNLDPVVSGMTGLYCNTASVLTNPSISYIDSPASSSAQTYTLYFWVSSGTGYINIFNSYGYTTITLMEIAA